MNDNVKKKRIGAYYIRVSTDDQAEFSPDSQRKKILEYAEKNNIIIPEEFHFEDIGISGREAEKRPQFMKMISIAKTKPKPFDIVLLWKFSRFARNREDSIVYKRLLRKKCEIDVVSISENLGDDKISELIEGIIETMDEFYSINLAEEVKRGMNEKFSRGGVVSYPPFGYKMGDGVFIKDEFSAPIVKMIYEWYLSGIGMRNIATKLNEMGIVSKQGNKFENRTVEYILTNPTYIGKLRRNPNGRDSADRFHQSSDNIIVDGKHEPIIRGIARCSNCGATLVQASKGKSLQCHRYSKGQCNVSHSILIESINEAVLEKLESDLENGEFVFEVRKTISTSTDINELLLKKEYDKLERAKTAYQAGIDTLEEYKMSKEVIKNKIKELEASVPQMTEKEISETMHTNLSNVIARIKDKTCSENEKNTMLRSIISSIIFDRKNLTIQIKYHSLY